MLQVYGSPSCGRCGAVKNVLKQKGIEHEYVNLDDLSTEEKSLVIKGARKAGKMTLPLLINNEQYYTLEEVTKYAHTSEF